MKKLEPFASRGLEGTEWEELEFSLTCFSFQGVYHGCGSHMFDLTITSERRQLETLRDELTKILEGGNDDASDGTDTRIRLGNEELEN